MSTVEQAHADTAKQSYQMPKVHIFDQVLVSDRYPFHKPVPGFIMAAYDDCADIMVFTTSGIGPREDCLYIDDPRLISTPDIVNKQPRSVFKFSKAEQVSRDMQQRMDDLEVIVRDMMGKSTKQAGTKTTRSGNIKG